MAKFHALPIALRRLRPKIFEEKIRPFLQRINLYEEIDTDGEILRVSLKMVFVHALFVNSFCALPRTILVSLCLLIESLRECEQSSRT